MPCAIGRGGIGVKQGEGDGITPVGCFELDHISVRPDRMAFNSGIVQTATGLRDKWSDDPQDPNYNQRVCAVDYPFTHERLRRSDPLYDVFGVLNFNWPDAVPGKGSAIFLHVWRKPRHPTEGCVAFAQKDLISIFLNWSDRSRVVIRG